MPTHDKLVEPADHAVAVPFTIPLLFFQMEVASQHVDDSKQPAVATGWLRTCSAYKMCGLVLAYLASFRREIQEASLLGHIAFVLLRGFAVMGYLVTYRMVRWWLVLKGWWPRCCRRRSQWPPGMENWSYESGFNAGDEDGDDMTSPNHTTPKQDDSFE